MGKRAKQLQSRNGTSLISSVQDTVRVAVRTAMTDCENAFPDETQVVVQLCMMGVLPTGKEDPKALLRSLSDSVINKLAPRFKRMSSDPVVGSVSQLFLMEWFHRHGHLDADWTWQWDTDREGHVRFCAKEPLDKLLGRLDRMC